LKLGGGGGRANTLECRELLVESVESAIKSLTYRDRDLRLKPVPSSVMETVALLLQNGPVNLLACELRISHARVKIARCLERNWCPSVESTASSSTFHEDIIMAVSEARAKRISF
jgi:hypothetical protein